MYSRRSISEKDSNFSVVRSRSNFKHLSSSSQLVVPFSKNATPLQCLFTIRILSFIELTREKLKDENDL